MRSIKDCVWEVRINRSEEVAPNSGNKGKKYPFSFTFTFWYWLQGFTFTFWYWFQATTVTPILNLEGQSFRTKKSAKANWEKFAKLNKIKRWKFV